MKQYAYISQVMSNVHESIEGWARDILRASGLETTEVYGQFPPEGSVASHLVVFPYRMSPSDTQLSSPYTEISLMGARSSAPIAGMPPIWAQLGALFTRCILDHFPKVTKGPHVGKPHPAPPVNLLPKPLADWYKKQGDSGEANSWVSTFDGEQYARLPSLVWIPGASLKLNYLVIVGEGARGTAERDAPIAIQAMSVLTAGMQLQRSIDIRIPPPPFDRSIIGYAEAVGKVLNDGSMESLLQQLEDFEEDVYLPITLLPGNSLSNSDFTGLMQALQRPLQPTLHMAVSLNVGGGPTFAPGINADVNSHQKARRPQGRA